MSASSAGTRHLSSAVPLAALFIGLVMYASLYPFTDWRWPAGASFTELLALPMPERRLRFDVWSNLIGYMPMGALVFLACVRSQVRSWPAWWLAVTLPALVSYTMEVTQQFLPVRVPSQLDLMLNAAGGVLGALLAVLAHRMSVLALWQRVRDRWFVRRSANTLVLMAVWPFGLLFPTPFTFGLGLGWERVLAGLNELLLDVPRAQDLLELLNDVPVSGDRYPAMLEGLGITLGFLGPCLLAFSVTLPGWRRVAVALSAAVLGLAASTLSATLSFGPAHALSWMSPVLLPGLAVGLVLALMCMGAGFRLVAALGIAVVCAQVMLVAQAPADPFFALTLQAWEQGRFIRFHGLAQWVGWLWPYLALVSLFGRIASRWD